MVYSRVEKWGISSAGWFCSEMTEYWDLYLSPGDGILQGGEVRYQLGRLILLRDGGVLGREGVPVEAEVAHPKLGPEINLPN